MTIQYHPIHTGYVDAADGSGHKIYYEEYGTPSIEQKPLIMVHGNIGALFDMNKLSMLDLAQQHVVLMHARGIGKSMPTASQKNNLYPYLAEDIETVRNKLNADKINLFGWSGGTAVALLYAEKYPEHCENMMLYGTYLGKKEDIHAYYEDLSQKQPHRWDNFCNYYGTSDIEELLHANNAAMQLPGNVDALIRYKMIFEPLDIKVDDIRKQQTAEQWQVT